MFHPDGCIIANIPTHRYRVTLTGTCEHTKIRQAVIDLDATSETTAVSYARLYLRIPQTEVTGVTELHEPATEPARPGTGFEPGCDPNRCRYPFGSHAPTCKTRL